jgi:hypothetical protein
VPVSVSNKHPAQPSCGRLDYVPRVESVYYGVTEASVSPQCHRYSGGGTIFDAGARACVGSGSVFERVWCPGEGNHMQHGEESHFDAKQARWNANVDVWVADFVCWFEGSTGGGGERYDHL